MKRLLWIVALLILTDTSMAKAKEHNQTREIKNGVVINIDKELEKIKQHPKKGKINQVVDTVIFIENNEKITFEGKILEKNSPVTIKVGRISEGEDDNDEVAFIDSFNGYQYTLETKILDDGDKVIIQDKDGKIISNQTIRFD